VLELTVLSNNRIRMRYWNADGREAEMCGNGLRCLVKLAVRGGLVDTPNLIVETSAGLLSASLQSNGLIRALVGTPTSVGDPFDFGEFTVHPIRIGNPHAVVFVEDIDEAPVASLGSTLELHEAFPDRSNVEFVVIDDLGRLKMRIWERGVGETLASGTGAAAAAYAASLYRKVELPIEVLLPGGSLTIELIQGEAWMIGPGNEVYRGSIGSRA